MAVKLRLRRMGKKRQPVYKVVAADQRSPRDGKFIESIGLYNPKTHPATVNIEEDRVLYWLSVGAQPTDTVKNLLSKKGILLKQEMIKKGLPEDEINSKMDDWNKIQEAKKAEAEKLESKKKGKKSKVDKETEKVESLPDTEIQEGSSTEATGTASEESQTEEDKTNNE